MDMAKRDIRKDLQPDAGDGILTVAKAGLGAFVLGGGTMAEFLSATITAPLSKRRDEWLIYLAEGYKQLSEKAEGIDWQKSLDDPGFVSLVVESCLVAVRNHREEKAASAAKRCSERCRRYRH